MLDQSNKKEKKENLENICIHPTKQIMEGQNSKSDGKYVFSSYFLYCQSTEK